jgi:hypothetical protein
MKIPSFSKRQFSRMWGFGFSLQKGDHGYRYLKLGFWKTQWEWVWQGKQ